MKKIFLIYFILLTGCSINSSNYTSLNESGSSENIITTTSNTTSETIIDFAYITGIELEDVKYAGYSLSGQSNRNLKDNKDDIEKIYNSINKEYSISDYTFEDINDPYLNRYSVYIYYSKWDYYLFDVYDNYLYFKTSIEDIYYYKSTTEWTIPL